MASAINDLISDVGELKGLMTGVIASLERIEQSFLDETRTTRESFKVEHDKVHDIVDALSESNRVLLGRVDAVASEIKDEITPEIRKCSADRYKREGAQGLLKWMHLLFGSAVTAGIFKLFDVWMSRGGPAPPPHP